MRAEEAQAKTERETGPTPIIPGEDALLEKTGSTLPKLPAPSRRGT